MLFICEFLLTFFLQMLCIPHLWLLDRSKTDSGSIAGGGGGGTCPPFFCNHLLFLKPLWRTANKLLFEVELIINNKFLTYVYPNTIQTCFTPNHLLFGRQLYSSNTTSTVARNLTILSSPTDKKNCISSHFLDRWRHGYIVNLCETRGTSKLNINSLKINAKDIVLMIFMKRCPYTFGEFP